MASSPGVTARAVNIAAGQWGLLTTAQGEKVGVTRLKLSRLAAAGFLEQVDRGVYAVAGSDDPHRTLRAAWLTLDPTRTAEERLADLTRAGVVSHTSAAGLRSLGDLLDDRPEFSLPYRKQTRRNIRLHRAALAADEVQLVEGLPTTTVERTVADLLRDGQDPDLVAQIVGQATGRGLVDRDVLAGHLDPLAKAHGEPDGTGYVDHLLEVAGLGLADQVDYLAKTEAGRVLWESAQATLLREITESARVALGKELILQLSEVVKAFPASAIPLPTEVISPAVWEHVQQAAAAVLAPGAAAFAPAGQRRVAAPTRPTPPAATVEEHDQDQADQQEQR
ncbi:type IV toxin-antitoxin system AbiEi family antitoxin domain-containing protein [Raineyella fluvialis]|uniref:AbiEi antitoxin N-terminal domain-containing protein n=1 Tax=Raineyella fluvialis TaxID=2662261 RepID=A0A5Q2FES3_9ACTN|nr:type IV toxin-antitoxin system AbiEi family antitoxin domain-containing protein [Raineyella fluvialis]QGF23583.1 hypothetical protein Rai3103_07785 [Raineyella fluvialis]